MKSWQLQEAKARPSELVKRSVSEGPQEITVHGKVAAVVLSAEEFARLRGAKHEPSWLEVFQRAPLGGEDLVIESDPDDRMRDIDL